MAETGIATEGAASSAPTDATQLTDEQIVGLEPMAAPVAEGEKRTEEVTTEAQSPQRPEEEAKPAAAAPTEEIPQDGRAVPAEFREIFKTQPKLRESWFRERAYQEVFPTVAEARAFREQFPGGLEDAKKLLEEVQEVSELDDLYYGGTAEGHRKLVDGLAQDDPKAFGQLAPIVVEKWAQADPEGYNRTLGAIVGETFQAQRLPEHIEAIRAQLKEGNAEGASKLTEELATWINGYLPGRQERVDPREAALRKREEELNRRGAEITERQQREFFNAYLGDVTEKATGSIKEFVGGLVPAEISEGARNRIVGDIFNAINAALGQNRAFMGERDRILRAGDRAKAVEYVLARAKQMLPTVGRKVLTEWTGTILAANKKQIEGKRSAAAKVDVGTGGAPEAKAKKPLTPKDVDYRKMSDEDILNA